VGYGAMSLGDWCPLFLRQSGGFIFRGWRIGPLQMTPPCWALIMWHSTISQKNQGLNSTTVEGLKNFHMFCHVVFCWSWVRLYSLSKCCYWTYFQRNVMHISFKLLPPPPIVTNCAILHHPYAVKLLMVV